MWFPGPLNAESECRLQMSWTTQAHPGSEVAGACRHASLVGTTGRSSHSRPDGPQQDTSRARDRRRGMLEVGSHCGSRWGTVGFSSSAIWGFS